MMTDKLAPGAARLAYIGQDVARAAPGEQLSVFVERANTAGKLLRKGFFTPEVIEQELWGVAIACKLTGEPGSESEEHIATVIETAVAIDNEPPPVDSHDAFRAESQQTHSQHAPRQLRFTQFSKIRFRRGRATWSKASSRTSAWSWSGASRSAARVSRCSTWRRTSPPAGNIAAEG